MTSERGVPRPVWTSGSSTVADRLSVGVTWSKVSDVTETCDVGGRGVTSTTNRGHSGLTCVQANDVPPRHATSELRGNVDGDVWCPREVGTVRELWW